MNYLNDLHCYAIGVLLSWGVSKLCGLILKDLTMHTEFTQHLVTALNWLKKIIIATVLGSIWVFFIPVCIGITLEAVIIVPISVSRIESVKYPLLQSWAIGIVLLTLWTRILLSGVIDDVDFDAGANNGHNGNNGNNGLATWRVRFLTVMRNGIAHIDGGMITTQILFPICIYYADILCSSYFVSRTLGYIIYTSTYQVRTLLIRYSFSCLVGCRIGLKCWRSISHVVSKVHDEARDKKYLVGVQLQNNANQNHNQH